MPKAHQGQKRKRPRVRKIGRGQASARCCEGPPQALLLGIQQFNQQQFFEAHETLEELWIEEADPIRYLYQGILQVGVGFHHWRNGNFRGADILLGRGVELLSPFLPVCMGVDVARLTAETAAAHQRLRELGPQRMHEFPIADPPRVHLMPPREAPATPGACG